MSTTGVDEAMIVTARVGIDEAMIVKPGQLRTEPLVTQRFLRRRCTRAGIAECLANGTSSTSSRLKHAEVRPDDPRSRAECLNWWLNHWWNLYGLPALLIVVALVVAMPAVYNCPITVGAEGTVGRRPGPSSSRAIQSGSVNCADSSGARGSHGIGLASGALRPCRRGFLESFP